MHLISPCFFNKINIILFSISLAACHSFSNRINKAELECGGTSSEADSLFVKLVTENGPAIDSVPLQDIKAQLVDLENKVSVMSLPITNKGCAILPKNRPIRSRMDVRVQNTTLAATRIFSNLPDNPIETLKLHPTRTGKYSLSCPQEGIFASRTFLNPLLITDVGSLETNQVTLVAQPVDRLGEAIPLMKKDFGFELAATSFGAEISTENLREGTYYLRTITATLAEDFGLLPKFVNDEKSCTLTVMKTPPAMSSELFSSKGFFVTKKNNDLPFKIKPEVTAIQYCRQPYQSRAQAASSCKEIAKECKNANEFKKIGEEATATPGLFDYFFYAMDRAGNKSVLQCQSIAVIDQAPAFSIDWSIPAWQQPNAYMKDAAVTIKPIITVPDEQTLPSNQVEQSLQCRAEFISQEGVTIRGSDVSCISGKCAGRSLQDFVPCDRNFEISLAKVWSHTYANNSTLKLTVQADTGIEPIQRLSRSINIQSKRWQVQKLVTPDVNWDQTIKLNQQSLLVSFRETGTFLWKDETWTKVFPSDIDANQLKNSKIMEDAQKNIYGFFEMKTDSSQSSKLSIYKYEDGNWRALADQPSFNDCKLIVARPDSGFTCLNSKAEILSFDGTVWMLDPVGPVSIEEPIFLSLHYVGQRLFLATSRGVYVRDSDNGAWQAQYSVSVNDTTNIMQVQAFDGDIWIYLSDRLTASMVRIEGLSPFEVSQVAIPKLKSSSLILGRAFEISETNQLYFFSYRWDRDLKDWQKVSNMPEVLPGYYAKFEHDLNGSAWIKSTLGFVDAKQGLFYPTANQGIDPSRALLTNEQGDLYFLGIPAEAEVLQFYKISRKNYVVLNQESSRLSLETFPDAWINSEGRISAVAFRKGEIQSLDNSSWNPTDSFPMTTETGFEEKLLPLRDDGFLIKTAAGLLLKRKGTGWTTILKRGDKLQSLLSQANPQDTVSTDTLKRISLVGEMPDSTIVLGIASKAGLLPLSDLVVIKQSGQFISKTAMSLTKLPIVQNVVITREGILLTGKAQLAGVAQPITLFALLNSNLELLQKSTMDVSNRYLELMNELAPGFSGEFFLGAFHLQASGRNAVCSYRSLPGDVSAGRFVCLELITSPSIAFGKPIAMPSDLQIKKARKSFQNYEPTRFARLMEGKTSSLFIFSGEVFTTPTLSESSNWTTRAPREQIVSDLGTDALIQSVFQDQNDRFILGIRNAGILVFD